MDAMSSPIRMDTMLLDPMSMHILNPMSMGIRAGIMLPTIMRGDESN